MSSVVISDLPPPLPAFPRMPFSTLRSEPSLQPVQFFLTVLFFFFSSRPQLQTLIQEADPGADYRIDRALNEACESVIQTACKHIRNGDPM